MGAVCAGQAVEPPFFSVLTTREKAVAERRRAIEWCGRECNGNETKTKSSNHTPLVRVPVPHSLTNQRKQRERQREEEEEGRKHRERKQTERGRRGKRVQCAR